MADCCRVEIPDSKLVYISLYTILTLPPFIFSLIADAPVTASNFGYEIVAPFLYSIGVGSRRGRIIALTDYYRKSRSKIGDYSVIPLDDPNLLRAKIVVEARVWKTVLRACRSSF